MTKETVKQIIADETFKFVKEMEEEIEISDHQKRTMIATAIQLKLRIEKEINSLIEIRQTI